jgi:hemolysin activation/secretion protein
MALACLALIGAPVAVQAQGVPNPGSPLPGILQPRQPAVAPPLPNAPPAAPGAVSQNVTVPVTDVAVEGATAYPGPVLSGMVTGLAGPAVPASAIESARVGLLNRYRADGYVYTTVDARIRAGHLRFVVTEGHIVDVKLDGHIGPAGVQVLRFLRHLTDIRPIDTKSLERWLLLAGDVPGITITSVLNPSTEDPGALTLVARVSRKPVSGQLSADNRAFRQTGPEELLALTDFNSFTSLGERTELSLYHTFNNTETFGQASEEFFIGGSGLKLKIYGGAGETIPSGSLRAINYDGITRVFGLQLSYPWIRSRQQTLNVTASFDGVESQISTNTGTGSSLRHTTFDSLRVLSGGFDYTLLDVVFGVAFPATDLVTGHASQGLPIFGASPNGDPSAPQRGERVDFTKGSAEIDRTQSLFTPFNGSDVQLKLAATGQYSPDTLPPAEKFYLGGPHFDRGFYYGEVTGDSALETTVEPQFDLAIPAPAFVKLPLSAQFYGFYDWGESWDNLKADADHVLRSLGGGVRFYVGDRAEIDLEGVSRLTRTPNGSPPEVSRLKSSAVYWQVLAHF